MKLKHIEPATEKAPTLNEAEAIAAAVAETGLSREDVAILHDLVKEARTKVAREGPGERHDRFTTLEKKLARFRYA
jgi:hypothetical protein